MTRMQEGWSKYTSTFQPCACIMSTNIPMVRVTRSRDRKVHPTHREAMTNGWILLQGRWKIEGRTSLVVKWLRIRLPRQGTWVWSLVQEDLTCRRATKPVHHNYWACALEPESHNYWGPCATTTEACAPRAHAPQQEKPPQWEACALQRRVAPTRCN